MVGRWNQKFINMKWVEPLDFGELQHVYFVISTVVDTTTHIVIGTSIHSRGGINRLCRRNHFACCFVRYFAVDTK